MTLGATMNAAFLASVYGQYIQGGSKENQQKGKRYVCWARGQVGPPAGLVRLLGMCAWLHEDAPACCPEKRFLIGRQDSAQISTSRPAV